MDNIPTLRWPAYNTSVRPYIRADRQGTSHYPISGTLSVQKQKIKIQQKVHVFYQVVYQRNSFIIMLFKKLYLNYIPIVYLLINAGPNWVIPMMCYKHMYHIIHVCNIWWALSIVEVDCHYTMRYMYANTWFVTCLLI